MNLVVSFILQRIVGGWFSTILAIPLGLLGASLSSPDLAASLAAALSGTGMAGETAGAIASITASVLLLLSRSNLFGRAVKPIQPDEEAGNVQRNY